MINRLLNQPLRQTIHELYHNKVLRYFFAAGTATLVDVFVYFMMLHYVLEKQNVTINALVIGAPSISLMVSYSCGLVTNFSITKYFVFAESELRGRSQFGRFVLVALIVLIANYFFMNFLIKVVGIYPTPSRAISALTIGVFSFVAHKLFSFKVGNKNQLED